MFASKIIATLFLPWLDKHSVSLQICSIDEFSGAPLIQYDTKYYYKIGSGDSAREFWFQTPPKIDPDAPYKFGIIGERSFLSMWSTDVEVGV